MIFRVTHIDAAGHRHKAHVTAGSVGNCIDQVEATFGPAKRLACVRLGTRPLPRLVRQENSLESPDNERSAPCVH